MPAEIIEFEQYTSSYAGNVTYDVSQSLKIVADNGSTITQAVDNTVYAGNGAASTVSSVTSAIAAGAATVTSAGYAIGALEVTTAGAMLIPALGLGAGALLYNLAPEFWTNVSNKLVDAGKTIGGKVACFFNEAGQTLIDSVVIDVFKDELFDGGYYAVPDQVDISNINLNNLWFTYSETTITRNRLPIKYTSIAKKDNKKNSYLSIGLENYEVYWTILSIYSNDGTLSPKLIIYCSPDVYDKIPNNEHFSLYNMTSDKLIYDFDITSLSTATNFNDGSNNKPKYYSFGSGGVSYNANNYTFDGVIESILKLNFKIGSSTTSKVITDYIYMALFGKLNSGHSYVEEGAILPSKDTSIVDTFHDSIHMENIPTDDPDRFIHAVPIEIPELNPGTTQEKALDPDNGDEAVQDDDTDIVGPIIRWIKDNIVLPDPSPDPDPDPTPQPDPDPDPQPEPDPLPEPDPVEDETDPIDPNPDPPTPDPPILPVLPSTVSSNKLFTVYNPTLSQLNSLGAFLWSNDIIDALKKIWQDPLEGVISLRQVFCSPVTGNSSNIILGTLDSGVSSLVVTEQFVTQECGTISLPEFFRNVTDYSPYTQLHLYLPFIGIVEINVNEFMNGSISITYHFDVYTGAVLTEVKCTRSNDMPSPTILYTFTGNASQALPITATNYQGAINATIGVATGALTLATGGGINPIFAMANMAHSVTHEMVHVNHASSLSGNAGIMGSRYPQLIVSRRKSFDANAYNDFYGYPTNKTVYLSNCSGYTRVKAIHFASVATQDEKDEIENLLKQGVIL